MLYTSDQFMINLNNNLQDVQNITGNQDVLNENGNWYLR